MPHVARDLYQKCREYRDSADARAQGFYPYFRCIEETHGNYVICEGAAQDHDWLKQLFGPGAG